MTSEKFIVGIDPGISGAIAFLRPCGMISVLDMPTTEIKVAGKRRNVIDLDRLCERFDRADIQLAMLEAAGMRATEARASTAKVFEGFGILKGVIAANYHKLEIAYPHVWKKAMGVTSDKNATRAVASQLMPHAAKFWPLKKHDGRAEAALLALYAARKHGIEIETVRAAQ